MLGVWGPTSNRNVTLSHCNSFRMLQYKLLGGFVEQINHILQTFSLFEPFQDKCPVIGCFLILYFYIIFTVVRVSFLCRTFIKKKKKVHVCVCDGGGGWGRGDRAC